MADAPEQIAEYEAQLAGIEELLAASPGDESLLVLKKDLEELLELTRANAGTSTLSSDTDNNAAPQESLPEVAGISSPVAERSSHEALEDALNQAVEAGATAAAAASSTTSEASSPPKKTKKKTKLKEFVVPQHLMAKENDSEQEKNRKNRALKKLKNKYRHEKKEVESNNKQKSWQSFQKKSSKKTNRDGSSIFSTKDGVKDRVGVVSKKQMTDFSARKRHKQL